MKKCFGYLLMALLLIAGCFDYEQTMVLNKDGSGTVNVHYAVGKVYLEQIKQMTEAMADQSGESNQPIDPAATMFSKSEIEETLKARNAGIKMLAYETSETDDSRVWDMEFSFDDVNKLEALFDALSPDDEEYAPPADVGAIYTRQPGGTWLFSQPFIDKDIEGEEVDEYGYEDSEDYYDEDYQEEYADEYADEYNEDDIRDLDMKEAAEAIENWSEQMKELVESMANYKVRITVNFPGDILESNATSTEGNSATWEYSIEQMQDAPEKLRAVIKP